MRVLTKNLVTFKRWIGFKDEKFQYYGGSLKMQFLGEGGKGGVTKKQYIGGLPGKGPWTVCRFKRVLGRQLIPQCTL